MLTMVSINCLIIWLFLMIIRQVSMQSSTNLTVPPYIANVQYHEFNETTMCDVDETTILQHLLTSTSVSIQELSPSFVPPSCPNSTNIGLNCNISNTPCDMLKPCQNNGSCHNNDTIDHGYLCSCPPGFDGNQCEFDHRPCKPNTCWNNSGCNETSNTTFVCLCEFGREGTYCERITNFCHNITCQNNGVCRPLFLNYSCECLGDNYSGRYCETIANKIAIRQVVSKSFAYIAIFAMVAVALFIVIMDVLKYVFGIDPVGEEMKKMRKKKQAKKRKPVIQRFVYVNAPPQTASTIKKTAV